MELIYYQDVKNVINGVSKKYVSVTNSLQHIGSNFVIDPLKSPSNFCYPLLKLTFVGYIFLQSISCVLRLIVIFCVEYFSHLQHNPKMEYSGRYWRLIEGRIKYE